MMVNSQKMSPQKLREKIKKREQLIMYNVKMVKINNESILLNYLLLITH